MSPQCVKEVTFRGLWKAGRVPPRSARTTIWNHSSMLSFMKCQILGGVKAELLIYVSYLLWFYTVLLVRMINTDRILNQNHFKYLTPLYTLSGATITLLVGLVHSRRTVLSSDKRDPAWLCKIMVPWVTNAQAWKTNWPVPLVRAQRCFSSLLRRTVQDGLVNHARCSWLDESTFSGKCGSIWGLAWESCC